MVLAELGPMKASEKGLIVIALLAIMVGFFHIWILKSDATAVAIVAMDCYICMWYYFLG